MKYHYNFYRDHHNVLRVKLPDSIKLFADFIEDISTQQELDEYVEDIKKVTNGLYEDFEIQLNAASVSINKDVTIVENNFRIEEPYENTIETEQFIELLLIWREKISERFKD
ncbi:tRNA-Val4 [Metabacillus halosaccharovorans]|uniref:tRNA-Val4 n=1 Tax=Metabacillus halosaccharovorans TaxID=930124 RepID=UPI0009950520|nr:tRNA-Val4 [Metabacillus halosaccharovorans]